MKIIAKDILNNAVASIMKILLAEYAMGIGMGGTLLLEGKAMISTLTNSFTNLGHDVTYLTSESRLKCGNAVISDESTFMEKLEETANESDAALVIGPDELLGDLTYIIEGNTTNLGCSSESARLCADKLACTEILKAKSVPVPEIMDMDTGNKCVVKPRFGCASEGVRLTSAAKNHGENEDEEYIATEYVEGEHLSAGMICGQNFLPLSLNKQLIEIKENNGETIFDYKGNQVPYRTDFEDEIFITAKKTVEALGCNGYVGIDFVYVDKPYVIDVNPRPTTAIFGLVKTLECEIGDLLLMNMFGELPESVELKGECSFTKDDIEDII
ncbi:ATP-grasp domain-containing protein [Methanolobus bombayensis]|uniref:ATP-grasp domain-containing protein n=1 Tax=Methanolobus bombayensis TaxID=38023 RepID=UPI001FD7C5BD|nr:ATP-grasp domain-containing protein [Methanolobus bombayensis]MBP1908930.1 putative ATP-grasp superfamily ATP-dependent carboligase [Methanolobus bombayensis]